MSGKSKTSSKDAKSVRLIKRGDVIVTREGDSEVVRNVQIVLQLANGSNPTYESTERVDVEPPEELPELP